MIFPAISSAPWYELLLARLFGRKHIGYDPSPDPVSPVRLEITLYQWRNRLYAISSREVCKHEVCRLKCQQDGGCKINAPGNRKDSVVRP